MARQKLVNVSLTAPVCLPDPIVIEAELVGVVQRILMGLPKEEQRALGPHLADTPGRYARALIHELLDGYSEDPATILATEFPDGYDEIMLLRGVQFYSLCAHHLLPFFGKAHVAYIPKGGKVVGLSKLARLVECYARRLQIQEQLTKQIGDCIQQVTDAKGVAVVIEARHMCSMMRGTRTS